MPWFGILFFIITLSAVAFPLTGGFISEFLILLGSYLSGGPWVWFAVFGLVLSALYMLRLYQKVFFLEESSLSQKQKDLTPRELIFLVPLAVLVFVMGIFPKGFLKYSQASLEHLQKHRYNYYLSTEKHLEKQDSNIEGDSITEDKSFQDIEDKQPEKTESLQEDFKEEKEEEFQIEVERLEQEKPVKIEVPVEGNPIDKKEESL